MRAAPLSVALLTSVALVALVPAGCDPLYQCAVGTGGCECLNDGRCRLPTLSCRVGICVQDRDACEGDNCIPEAPRCFSPCQEDLVGADGAVRNCSPQGLLEGCVGDQLCDQGSCVPPHLVTDRNPLVHACDGELCTQRRGLALLADDACDDDPRCCRDAGGCPEHQICIRGGCYSDCDADDDCGEGLACVKHACRKECGVGGGTCGQAEVCSTLAHCTPSIVDETALQIPVGDFSLATDAQADAASVLLRFGPSQQSGSFEIRNDGAASQSFIVRKSKQTTVNDDGSLRVLRPPEAFPMAWIELGQVGATERLAEMTVVVPGGAAVQIQLDNARTETLPRWSGVIEVVHDQWGVERVRLTYNEGLAGRWTGAAYYFGDFPDGATVCGADAASDCVPAQPLEEWLVDRDDEAALGATHNAFLQAWARFRDGRFPYLDLSYLTGSMLSGDWAFPRTEELCRLAGHGDSAACALAPGPGGRSVIEFTSDREQERIPGAMVELPLSLVVQSAATPGDHASCIGASGQDSGVVATHCLLGRIESEISLQYPGDPELALRFGRDPQTACEAQPEGTPCLIGVDGLTSRLAVGGRTRKLSTACPDGLDDWSVPWLLPGFDAPAGGADYVECRDREVPLAEGVSDRTALNMAFAGANPAPDGGVLYRELELLDGVVVEQEQMLLIFREWIGIRGQPGTAKSYAYAVLTRSDSAAGEDSGNPVSDPTGDRSSEGLAGDCHDDLLDAVLPERAAGAELADLTGPELEELGRAVVRGDNSADSDPELAEVDPTSETVHYVCVWGEDVVVNSDDDDIDPVSTRVRNAIDSQYADGSAAPCHPSSTVVYFTTAPTEAPQEWSCNAPPQDSCLATIRNELVETSTVLRISPNAQDVELTDGRFLVPDDVASATTDLTYTCDGGRPSCDDDRTDLLLGKTFYQGPPTPRTRSFSEDLDTTVDQAFAYRTQFTGLTGQQVGFVPEICRGEAGLLPFCFDPADIVDAQRRDDCAKAVYERLLDDPPLGERTADHRDATVQTLRAYAERSVSVRFADNPFGDPVAVPGFERLFTELMLLLGDDALTEAYAARFDLAGTQLQAFAGSRFEVNGPDLTGAAGHELYKLYQSIQYHSEIVDRFAAQLARWQATYDADTASQFITPSTITDYLPNVVSASTGLATAWAEVARRYEGLNRPDLARSVLERAYARTFLEGRTVTDAIEQVAARLGEASQDQARIEISTAQLRYRVALLDMAEQHAAIRDGVSLFGFAPEYVPFPALQEFDTNPVDLIFDLARTHADAAAQDEDRALERRIEFDVDAAEFQRELVDLRQGYEERLGQLCGRFDGDDGRVYPALRKYAHLSDDTKDLPDPCGALSRGDIWIKFFDLETAQLGVQQVEQEVSIVRDRIRIAKDYADEYCDEVWSTATTGAGTDDSSIPADPSSGAQGGEYKSMQEAVDALEGEIDELEHDLEVLDYVTSLVFELVGQTGDLGDSAASAATIDAPKIAGGLTAAGIRGVGLGISAVLGIANMITKIALGDSRENKLASIREDIRAFETRQFRYDCVFLDMEQKYQVEEITLDLGRLELEALGALWDVQQNIAELGTLDRERRRLEAELQDKEQLAIHVAAAKNDPNRRIFRNDAIINADRTFTRAVRTAYRATRVFEYYSGGSYAALDELFLVRMVRAGDVNLSRYLDDLEDAFYEFQEQYGVPDTRVMVLSVVDDALEIEHYTDSSPIRVLTQAERVAKFRETLVDPRYRDDQGRLSIPFSTELADMSPVTYDHKVLGIEVDIVADDSRTDDEIGRIYLTQEGAAEIRTADGGRLTYAFEPRTAVVNPSFNGDLGFNPDTDHLGGPNSNIYRNFRLRERPLVNSAWRLTLDTVDELENRDIELSKLQDILIRIYYTDLTRPL